MAEIDVFTLKEELDHFASSLDSLMLSAEGEFSKMVNYSEAICQDNKNEFNLDFIDENEDKEVDDDDDNTELEHQNPGTESEDNDTNVVKIAFHVHLICCTNLTFILVHIAILAVSSQVFWKLLT